jgi:3-hydroxymyristoyl/3-hydroxydecanoyl-(acyl carrier protein) dehydratase
MSLPLALPQPHPALEGHFPGEPILPGAVLLDEALHAIESAEALSGRLWRIDSVKFLAAVADGTRLLLDYERNASGALRFTIRDGGRLIATGTLVAHA